ncbi:hypothetical protein CBL_08243 [Carabus blaptoides fortunei]
MSSVEEITEVLDLPETDAVASRCSTDAETDTRHEKMSPDLVPSDEEDLPIACTVEHVTSHSATNAEKNSNAGIPGFLTPARREMLAKLAPSRYKVSDTTLFDDIIQNRNNQMFTVFRMPCLNKSKSSKSAVESLKSPDMASTKENLGHSSSGLNSVDHSEQNQEKTEQDDGVTEPKMVTEVAPLNLHPESSLDVNVNLETTEPDDVELSAIPTDLLNVAGAQPEPVQSHKEENLLDAQLTVKPTSPETDAMDTDEHLELAVQTIQDNDNRSLVVNNIDIYKNIQQAQPGKYQLDGVPFEHVIITGVITSKSVTRNSITQLEVDDGSAVVICLFDDRLGMPEHRDSFHQHLDHWEHNMPSSGTDAVFDETFHFLREYGKRLFQETPQSGDLNLGDEVTIMGKVHDSKNDGRVIYHKCLWRKVDLASRENCGYVQNQFAKPGKHF